MKINKDLMDAFMMLSIIGLVLIGTTDFDSTSFKNILMAIVAVIAVISLVCRIIEARQNPGSGGH